MNGKRYTFYCEFVCVSELFLMNTMCWAYCGIFSDDAIGAHFDWESVCVNFFLNDAKGCTFYCGQIEVKILRFAAYFGQ